MSATISNVHQGNYGNYPSQDAAVKHNQQDALMKKEDDSAHPGLSEAKKNDFANLTQEEQSKVQQLKSRDLEVRAHEQAHLSAAGALATSGASFSYTKGPNGVSYATGGEVGIDTSPVNGDPAATIRKADIIRRAALAPASPSAQDQRVASKAAAMAEKARSELIQKKQEKGEQADAYQLNGNRFNSETESGIDFTV